MAESRCVICRHRKADRGHVCTPCLTRTTTQLVELPRKMRDLTLHLVPGGTGMRADRVSQSRSGTPVPVRIDALALAGPGTDQLTRAAIKAMTRPVTSRVQVDRAVTVTVPGPAGTPPRDEERVITVWQETAVVDAAGRPVVVVDDDQVGLLPPAEWLDLWVRRWRIHFGHHVPAPERSTDTSRGRQALGGARPMAGQAGRDRAAATVLGLIPGYRGQLPRGHRVDDPVAAEWEIRFGAHRIGSWPGRDVGYLLTWLSAACDHNVDVGVFAAELRALDAELVRVLGEQPDQQWLGRCPASITDHSTGESQPCGAGLWQDPHASQVECPHCHATWGPRRIDLFHLATAIRAVWPLDRRRRYTRGEIAEIPDLRCAGCGTDVAETWMDVTAVGDRERWWRPVAVTCPQGCTNPGRFL